MSKVKIFEDGTSIKWIDKETLKYIENEYSVDIWVDFEPDFFNNGRIIKSSSLVHWQTKPDGASDVINEIKKAEILQKSESIIILIVLDVGSSNLIYKENEIPTV